MTKEELQDCLFSLKIAHDYLKTYGLQDHDKDHVLMHLKLATKLIENPLPLDNLEGDEDNF